MSALTAQQLIHAESVEEARNLLSNHIWKPLLSTYKEYGNSHHLDCELTDLENSLYHLMYRVISMEFCEQSTEMAKPRKVHIPSLENLLVEMDISVDQNTKILDWLTIDGEIVYPSIRRPLWIFVLWHGIVELSTKIHPLLILRAASLYQRCLKRRSHTLFTTGMRAVESLQSMISQGEQANSEMHASVLLEIALFLVNYHESDRAMELIRNAARIQQMRIEEAALVGIRTKWQCFQTAQLVVNASSALGRVSGTDGDPIESLPMEVDGEKSGHDLYTRPRKQYDQEEELTALSPLQCSILLAMCEHIERENPDHDMTRERIQAYVERILANTGQSSIILAMALLTRSRIEYHRPRVAQRSLLQIQQLLDDVTVEKKISFSDDFYSVSFPSIHELRAEVGKRYFDQNLHRTALGYFQELQDWPNVIRCATHLEHRQSVADIAKRLLEKDPLNVQLLIALGMSTNDERTLLEAWEVSRHRNAEAARALAAFYVRQEEYHSAMNFFNECVSLNPIFGADWFTLGYSAMRLNDWTRAAEAFTRVCQIEPENPVGWNNLAMCLIRSKKFRPALHALTQALKFDRTSWQMWQNHFSLAVELGELNTALCSLENLVRFGGRKIDHDTDSLRALVDQMVRLFPSRDESASARSCWDILSRPTTSL
ncbi:hypothetical protein XU18_0834 [Perkinsela sp. CCAP 1560/4]|nr:hypothetical protein XU18_0834 [Perkinsela sp. CCAP 1560/4]|eukprot:KNH08714.1 hypothetical protein XU18_0834 [Perkinsela sp. CCAP 1560/4]